MFELDEERHQSTEMYNFDSSSLASRINHIHLSQHELCDYCQHLDLNLIADS